MSSKVAPEEAIPQKGLGRRNSLQGVGRPACLEREQTSALEGLTGKRQRCRVATNNSFTGSKPTDLQELRERHEMAQLQKQMRFRNRIGNMFFDMKIVFGDQMASFQTRSYTFDPSSRVLQFWDWIVVGFAVYSVVYVPLLVALPAVSWNGSETCEALLDALFIVDVCIKLRTSFLDHGYLVTTFPEIAYNYLRGWLIPDVLCAVPFDRVAAAMGASYATRSALQLLRVLRVGRLFRKTAKLSSANIFLMVSLILSFVLLAHWLGLGYHVLAVRPLELKFANDTATDWIWIVWDGVDDGYGLGLRYICSIYWSLSVMTNLKGLPAHETRQCLIESEEVLSPLAERIYTIFTFLTGAIFYSVIYGNIAQFIQAYYSSTLRFRKRMDEVAEFSRFHNLPKHLRKKMHNYLEFAFSVTKGISVEAIVAQMPAHLQLEVHLELNKKLVAQVHIFNGCDADFFDALVIKLQPCIVVSGVYVFYDGEAGNKMYFVKHGMAEVLKAGKTVFTFREGDYFGEIALLSDMPRTADVRAVTDCMLLSLSLMDFEHVLGVFPEARERIRAAAQARYKELLGVSGQASRMGDEEHQRRLSSLTPAGAPPKQNGDGDGENRLSKLMKSYGLTRGSGGPMGPNGGHMVERHNSALGGMKSSSGFSDDGRRDSAHPHHPGRRAIKPARRNTTTSKASSLVSMVRRPSERVGGGSRVRHYSGDTEKEETEKIAEVVAVEHGVAEVLSRRPSVKHAEPEFEDASTFQNENGAGGPYGRKNSLLSQPAAAMGSRRGSMRRDPDARRPSTRDPEGRRLSMRDPNDTTRVRRISMSRPDGTFMATHSMEHGIMDKLKDTSSFCCRRSIEFGVSAESAQTAGLYSQTFGAVTSDRANGSPACQRPAGRVQRLSKESVEAPPAQVFSPQRLITPPSSSPAEPALDPQTMQLFQAINDGDAQSVGALLKDNQGVKINLDARDTEGNTALILAAEGEVECVRLLLEAGANPNQSNNDGKSALWVAINYQDSAIVEMLVKASAKISTGTIIQIEGAATEMREVLTRCVQQGSCNINDDAAAALRDLNKQGSEQPTFQGSKMPKRRSQSAGPETIPEAASFRERGESSVHGGDSMVKTGTRSEAEPEKDDDKADQAVSRLSSTSWRSGVRRTSIVNFFFKRKQLKEGSNKNSVDLKDLRRSGEEADVLSKDKRTSRRRHSQGSSDSLEDNEAVNDVVSKVLKASLDDKLKQLREDLARDLRRTNTEPLERIESIVLMMASKLDNVLNRQIQGDTWM